MSGENEAAVPVSDPGLPASDRSAPAPGAAPDGSGSDRAAREPCLRCGRPLPRRLMGCKGGRCPNCGHLYPHGDCSD